MTNKIKKRIYTAWKLRLDSPMNLSGGEDLTADSDFLRNGRGELFIPGTSLAGVFRSYLKYRKNDPCLFGYSEGKKGFMSKVFVSDVYLTEHVKTSVRDGIRLGEDRIVLDKSKYDMEIVETGAEGILYLECVIREQDEEAELYEALRTLARGIQLGEIRLGAKTTRGFGRIRLLELYEQSFEADDREQWLDFLDLRQELSAYRKWDPEQWLQEGCVPEKKYLQIRVPLKQKGGISIRRYSAKPGQTDYEHITCNGEPVIPGSSWAGVIRAAAGRILRELGFSNKDVLLNDWFGTVPEKKTAGDGRRTAADKAEAAEKAAKSKVIISESILTDGGEDRMVSMSISRNRINRFDASTVNGALYSETACFNGHTTLEFLIRKEQEDTVSAITTLLLLIIRDIQNGFLAVGGQTAVGRGIFEADGEICFSEEVDEPRCMEALCSMMAGNSISGERMGERR